MICPKCNTTNSNDVNICNNCNEVLTSNVKKENNVITIYPRKRRKKQIINKPLQQEIEVLEDIELEQPSNNVSNENVQTLENKMPEIDNMEVLENIETLEVENFDNQLPLTTNNSNEENTKQYELNSIKKTKTKMNKKYKILLIIIGVILSLLLLLSLFLMITNRKKEIESTTDIVTNTTFFLPNDDHKYAIFDDNGNKITDFIYTDYYNFNNGGSIVYQDDKVGIVNESGKMTIDFGRYKDIESSAGLYKVHDSDYNYYLVDSHGNILYDLKDKDITTFKDINNYSILKDKNKKQYDILNNKGFSIISFKMNSDNEPTANDYNEYISIFYDKKNYILNVDTSKKIISFESEKQYCVNDIEKSKNIIILKSCSSEEDATYQAIKDGKIYNLENICQKVYVSEKNVICESNNEQKLLNEEFEASINIASKMYVDNNIYAQSIKDNSVEFYNGTENIKTINCRSILDSGYANKGIYLLNIKKTFNCPRDDFDYEYYKIDGTLAFDKKFKRAKQFDSNGVAQVSDDGNRYYLINEFGEKISDEYNFFSYNLGYYIASNNGLKGVIDKNGNEVIPCKYLTIEIIQTKNNKLVKAKDANQKYIVYNLTTGDYLLTSNEDLSMSDHYIEVSKNNKIEYYTYKGKMFHQVKKNNS